MGRGDSASRKESVVYDPPPPAADCTMVSEATSSEGRRVSWPMILAITWSSVVAMWACGAPTSGRVALSQVAGVNACTEPAVALFSRFPKDDTYFLYGSSDFRIGLSWKSAPAPDGVHLSMAGPYLVLPMMAPCGR